MKIFLAGHNGMVGRSILSKLSSHNDKIVVCRARDELDLLDEVSVKKFFKNEKFDGVIIASAKVGGIFANNTYPADFIYENIQIQNNIINIAHNTDVEKILFLGSSCIYPKDCKQPIKESSLLTGALEPTNEPYAVAKIAGIKMCESYNRQFGRDYRSLMPTNLYGPWDNFGNDNSHVFPALIRRFHEAKVMNRKTVKVWGSGEVMREFLHVSDLADAALFVFDLPLETYKEITLPNLSHLNVGAGKDIKIRDLAQKIKKVVGCVSKIIYDKSKPDGTPRKLLDTSKLTKLGWKAKIGLDTGIKETYEWYLKYKK